MKYVHEQEKIDELILDWYRLSTGDEVDQTSPFFRFVAVWVAFNAFYSSRMYDVGDSGIAQVHAFARQAKVRNQHKMLLNDDSEYRKAVEVLQEKGVYNTQKGGKPWQVYDRENFIQVASCIYQVRNNLFHGGKGPSSMRDRHVVNAAYEIISRIMLFHIKNAVPTDRSGRS